MKPKTVYFIPNLFLCRGKYTSEYDEITDIEEFDPNNNVWKKSPMTAKDIKFHYGSVQCYYNKYKAINVAIDETISRFGMLQHIRTTFDVNKRLFNNKYNDYVWL